MCPNPDCTGKLAKKEETNYWKCDRKGCEIIIKVKCKIKGDHLFSTFLDLKLILSGARRPQAERLALIISPLIR